MIAATVAKGVPATIVDVLHAEQLVASMAAEFNRGPDDRRADCAALCIGDLQGWIYIARREGATRQSLAQVIRHCFWRFREEFKCEPYQALETQGVMS